MLEEKSKTQQGEASSVLDTLKEKVNKINMDTMKSINKVETNMKDMKREVDHKLEDFK